tara:strand:- start:85 stop:429 length:345 start_codon:yes stop_codon:yes gene_type:complete
MYIFFNNNIQIGTTSSDEVEMSTATSKVLVNDYNEDNIYTLVDGEAVGTTNPEPTAEEISANQAMYQATKYKSDRAKAYPSLEEQADMAYWDRQNGTTTLDDAISAVKDAHPKP